MFLGLKALLMLPVVWVIGRVENQQRVGREKEWIQILAGLTS